MGRIDIKEQKKVAFLEVKQSREKLFSLPFEKRTSEFKEYCNNLVM